MPDRAGTANWPAWCEMGAFPRLRSAEQNRLFKNCSAAPGFFRPVAFPDNFAGWTRSDFNSFVHNPVHYSSWSQCKREMMHL
jgi:hypothetical protein